MDSRICSVRRIDNCSRSISNVNGDGGNEAPFVPVSVSVPGRRADCDYEEVLVAVREIEQSPSLRGKGCTMLATMLLLIVAVGPFDVRANPPSPSLVASDSSVSMDSPPPAPVLKLLGRWHGGPVYSSAVSGDHVYFGTGGGIRGIKIDQATPSWKEVASIATAGVVRDLAASGSHLYVADDSGALRIIDISAPSNPREIAYVELEPVVRGVSVEGQYAYLAAGWSGLIIIDISDPEQPRVVQKHKTPYIAQDVFVTGSLALVTNSRRGVRMIDVSNPLQPREVGSYEMPGFTYGVFALNDYAYVVAGSTTIASPPSPIRYAAWARQPR